MKCGLPYLDNMSEDYINYNYKMPATKSKQTAVEWLVSQLNKQGFAQVVTDEEIQQAKEMEKQQLEDAWYAGDEDGAIHEFEYYYNETFGK